MEVEGRCLAVLVLVAGLVAPGPAAAQDSHYWTRQFGNRAWLLGGAVIGAPLDISAVYYNPGAVALLREPEIQLSGNVFEYTFLGVGEGVDGGRDLSTASLVGSPSLVAGELGFDFLGDSRLAYSLLTRQRFNLHLESRGLATGSDLLGVPGLERLSTEVQLEQDVSEYWAGFTWAYPFGSRVAVGVSPFLAVRNQRARFLILRQGAGGEGQALLFLRGREFRYLHARLLAKLGLSLQQEPWALGVTVTTPALSLWGRGASGFDHTTFLQGPGPGSEAPAVVASDFLEDLPARYHTPFSVGIGASRQLGHTTFHVSAEWFDEVDAFPLFGAEPFTSSAPPEALPGGVFFGLAPIVNVAVGVEQRLGERLLGYLSFHTDFSGAVDAPGTNASVAAWNLYHTAAGVYFAVGPASVTLGGNVAVGSQSARRFRDILSRAGLEGLSGARIRFLQVTFLLGASFQFTRPPA
jgi:hypothetical protein